MQEIRKILDIYTEEMKRIYGTHLHKILLYGSYARGEETGSSVRKGGIKRPGYGNYKE